MRAGATYKEGACAIVVSFGFCLADFRRLSCGSLERERERESCVAIAMAENDNMEVEAAAVVPTVPETLLKKRKRDEEWASARKQQLEAARSKNVKNRQLIFKRAEQYIKEYRSQVRGNRCSI